MLLCRVEGNVAPLRACPHGIAVVEIAHRRLGPELAHARRGALRAS